MSRFTGLQSFTLKMVSILFIAILNVTSLSSQTSAVEGNEPSKSYPAFQHETDNRKATVPVRPEAAKKEGLYTLFSARNFPVLECSAVVLHAKDDTEVFDYDVIFGTSRKHTTANLAAALPVKTIKKNQKNSVPPKLN